jgi:hypothetical protein
MGVPSLRLNRTLESTPGARFWEIVSDHRAHRQGCPARGARGAVTEEPRTRSPSEERDGLEPGDGDGTWR